MERQTNTGFKGVSKRANRLRPSSKYEASVHIDGNRVFYKGTKTLAEAVKARTNFITNLL